MALNTQLAAAAGALFAMLRSYMLKTKTIDVGMAGNGAIAGLVGDHGASGYVEFWAAPMIGAIAGVIVVFGVLTIEKYLDDPVGALSAHGLAGIWGTLPFGLFASDRLLLDAAPGVWYGIPASLVLGLDFGQLGVQAVGVVAAFALGVRLSYATFALIKATIGLRVSEEEELAGLDISDTRDVRLPGAVHSSRRSTRWASFEPNVAGPRSPHRRVTAMSATES